LAETWSEDATIGEIGQTTDFAPDLLEPKEPFSRTPVKRKYAPFDVKPATTTSRSASPKSREVSRARSASPGKTGGPSTRSRSKSKSKSPNRIHRQSPATVRVKAQGIATGAQGTANVASTYAQRQLPLDPTLDAEPSPKKPAASPKSLQRRAAAIMLAEEYSNTSFKYIDNHQTTGNVETLTGTVVGATVFASTFARTPDQGRLIAQLSDGSARLMTPDQVAQSPTAPAPTTAHCHTTLFTAPSAVNIMARWKCDPSQASAIEEYSTELMQAIKDNHVEIDEYSFECSPITGAVTMMREREEHDADMTTPLSASSLINHTDSREDAPADAHIEPQDRAVEAAFLSIPAGLSDAPTNLKEAQRRPDWAEWKEACMIEMNTLQESATIVLGIPPPGAKVVPSLTQLRLKRNEDGKPSRRKARFCARGDLYTAGPDVPIFAPTAPWATVRMLLSIACAMKWLVKTFDVAAAFTSVERTGLPDIWLAAPRGLGYPEGQACHLLKNLYGFQHSPRAFYDAFSEYLIDVLKFERCSYDKTLFKRTTTNGVIYMSIYVDDALVISSTQEAWDEMLQQVEKKYTLSSVGDATLHLGLTIKYDRKAGTLALGNAKYVEQIAKRFGIDLDVTTASKTPCSKPRLRLYPNDVTQEPIIGAKEQQEYRAGVGSLNWMTTTNRPDLSFTVSQLARHLAAPTASHVACLYHALRYAVVITRDLALTYHREPVVSPMILTADEETVITPNRLIGFCDADFANAIDTRKSHTGFVFLLNNADIDWKSSQQRLVASSSTESEYLVLSHCSKGAEYLRHVLAFLDQPQTAPTPIMEDNAACICLCNSDSHESRLKHLDIHLHNARQHVARNTIALYYVSTVHQAADFLTKALAAPQMIRPTAVVFGSNISTWNANKDLMSPSPRRQSSPRTSTRPNNQLRYNLSESRSRSASRQLNLYIIFEYYLTPFTLSPTAPTQRNGEGLPQRTRSVCPSNRQMCS
jgi:hypothetical protein